VHNGIIENYASLKVMLKEKGHNFKSDTDSEVLAHLIEENLGATDVGAGASAGGAGAGGDAANAAADAGTAAPPTAEQMLQAIRKTIPHVEGAYGLAVINTDIPDKVFVTRKDSPIILGIAKDASLVASDIPAIIEHTRDVVYLKDGETAVLESGGKVACFDTSGAAFDPEIIHIDWDIQTAERAGFPDFMLKEITEQPRVVYDTIAGRLIDGRVFVEELGLTAQDILDIEKITIVACGTSYHAGLIARQFIERWARISTSVELASEYRYTNPIIKDNEIIIAITQSGETADTLAAVRLAKQSGAQVYAITNVLGSSITREVDGTLLIKANLEISVAATKSFVAQVSLLAIIAMYFAQENAMLDAEEVAATYFEMLDIPRQIEHILNNTHATEAAAKDCVGANSALFIGRGYGSVTCAEGALKLKEISYLHAEAYSAGEVKHGPIALISEGFPVIAIATQSPIYSKMISNIVELKSRGAKIIAVATEGDEEIVQIADHVLYIPQIPDSLSTITASVVLQLFAREIAICRGCNVDKPRNLAKSVTVE
jgi:glucosamine--fructose-6-phosphate aminotransferase (isomerizing)